MHSASRSLKRTINVIIVFIGVALVKKLANLAQYKGGNTYRVFNVRFPDTADPPIVFISTAIFVILFIALIYYLILLRSSVKDFMLSKFFTANNSRRLKKVSTGFLAFVIIYFICSLFLEFHLSNLNPRQLNIEPGLYSKNHVYSEGYALGYTIGLSIGKNFALSFLIIFSLFISFIAETVNLGSLIKSENDLTI